MTSVSKIRPQQQSETTIIGVEEKFDAFLSKMCFVKISENILLHAKLVNLVSGQSRVRFFLFDWPSKRVVVQFQKIVYSPNLITINTQLRGWLVKKTWGFVENLGPIEQR